MIIQGIRYASDFEAKKLMIETGRDLDEKGYTLAEDGSMSVRVGPNAVWVTTGGSENGSLAQGDFVRVDLNGKSMNHSPDAVLPEDLEVHLKIYRENAQIQGVIHAYPACAVVLQKQGRGLEVCDYTPAVRSLGKITLVPTGDPGQISACAALAAKSDKGVLLENDGCLMWGASIREAYRNIRLLDYCAKVRSLSGGCAQSAGNACPGQAAIQPAGVSAAGSTTAGGALAGGSSAGALQSIGAAGRYTASGRTASVTGADPTAGIPGLTGLYHPSGTSGISGPGAGPASISGSVPNMTSAGNVPNAVPAGNTGSAVRTVSAGNAGSAGSASGIPGLTGLYRPSSTPGLPRQGGNMMKQAGSSGLVKQSFASGSAGTASPVPFAGKTAAGIAASGGMQTDNRMIQSAPSDPVRDATMAEVVKKSMKMMGKGGL